MEKRKVGRPKKDKKLRLEDITNEDGEIVSIGKNTKERDARNFKNMVEHPNEFLHPKRGMYAGIANPESFVEMYKKSVANRKKKGNPWHYPTRKALEDEILKYFEFCVDRRIPVTVAGVCAWLGISTSTLSKWKQHQDTQPYYDIAESTVAFIHAMTEQGAVEGNIPATVFSFLARNYHGLKDQMDYFVTPNENMSALEVKNVVDKLPDIGEDDKDTDE